MATVAEVHGILQLLATELCPRKGWAIEEGPHWSRAFERIDVGQIRRAAEKWLARNTDRVPKLAEFRRLVSSEATPVNAASCGRCADGWRGVAWHRTGRTGDVEIHEFAARCTCGAGAGIAASVPDVRTAEAALRSRAGTLEVYVDPTSDQRNPLRRERPSPSEVLASLRAALVEPPPQPTRPAPTRRDWSDGDEVPY